jgi:predicted O-methyltransferase YrrM
MKEKAIMILKAILPFIDLILMPVIYPAAFLLKMIRLVGVHRMPFCKRALFQVGVFPIRNHYFEPLFDGSLLRHPLDQDRFLPGIDWNVKGQLALLQEFSFSKELMELSLERDVEYGFDFNNDSFRPGDSEFLYSLIRLKKPARIIEIGSGNSTLIAIKAVQKNKKESSDYQCRHICIEPYEVPWLEETGVAVIREKAEDIDRELFAELEKGDILFIDSTHVIRPQGDVLFEYLELLPTLKTGVIVHVHDIFSPKDYPKEWIMDEVRLWNEQYLLEAFLTGNPQWKIIGALNYLHHNHFELLQEKCPILTRDEGPGSFYMEKVA